jgi:hypothetical protein
VRLEFRDGDRCELDAEPAGARGGRPERGVFFAILYVSSRAPVLFLGSFRIKSYDSRLLLFLFINAQYSGKLVSFAPAPHTINHWLCQILSRLNCGRDLLTASCFNLSV